jgi:hypothetical protein
MKSMRHDSSVWHESSTCSVALERVAQRRVLVSLFGHDLGALGETPFRTLERLMHGGEQQLFFDLSEAKAVSLDVSARWAIWLRANRARLSGVSLLPRAPLIRLSAQTVTRFSELGSRALVYHDSLAFERALLA